MKNWGESSVNARRLGTEHLPYQHVPDSVPRTYLLWYPLGPNTGRYRPAPGRKSVKKRPTDDREPYRTNGQCPVAHGAFAGSSGAFGRERECRKRRAEDDKSAAPIFHNNLPRNFLLVFFHSQFAHVISFFVVSEVT